MSPAWSLGAPGRTWWVSHVACGWDLPGCITQTPGHHLLEGWDFASCCSIELTVKSPSGNRPGLYAQTSWCVASWQWVFLDSDDKNRGHAWPCRGREVDTSLAWWHRRRYCVSALGPRTQEANGSPWLVVLGSAFHKIVVPCSQIQMIKRANIPSTYYVSSPLLNVCGCGSWHEYIHKLLNVLMSLRAGFWFFSRASSLFFYRKFAWGLGV